jgi:hypothetical protein
VIDFIRKDEVWEVHRDTVYCAERVPLASDFIGRQTKLLLALEDDQLEVRGFQTLSKDHPVDFDALVALADDLNLD